MVKSSRNQGSKNNGTVSLGFAPSSGNDNGRGLESGNWHCGTGRRGIHADICGRAAGIKNRKGKVKDMNFGKALEALKAGCKVKLPSWAGYWEKEGDTVKMHCKDGKVLDIRETEDVFYTLAFIASDEWETVDGCDIDLNIQTVRFGEALRLMEQGRRMARKGWRGNGMFAVYQKGYPDGIPCNRQTAEAWGMNEGDLFKCNPYLQIRQEDGSHSMWMPSVDDMLAEDWVIVG